MALHDYRGAQCGLEFEVSRPMSQAAEPVPRPVDGTESPRVFTMPMTFSKTDFRGPPTSTPGPRGWSHHGHAPGMGHHSHRGPR
jgi:hypothetical protein